MKNPKVTIIIPVFNTAQYLSTCLNSVISQTYQNLEIIVIDDGSTDTSPNIISEYAKKDNRIKIITQKNQGQSTARNTGLKNARGDYVSFIDSDDKVSNTFIEQLLQPYLNHPNVALTVCGVHYNWLKTKSTKNVYINKLRKRRNHETKETYTLFLLTVDGRMYSSTNKLYKRSFINGIQFDKTLNFAEDTKFVLDYLKNTPNDAEITFITKALYHYYYGTANSTIKKTSVHWSNWHKSFGILKKWVGPKPSIKQRFWLKAINLRWLISYMRSKKRNKS